MKRFMILLAASTAFAASVAHAGPLTNGAYSLVTIRGCTAGDTSAAACYPGGTGLSTATNGHRIAGVSQSNYDGGVGQNISDVDYNGIYGRSRARSEYAGPLAMPVLGVETQATYTAATALNENPLDGFRLGSHAYNYQTYQYDGTTASPFSLQVNLHYIVSGDPSPDTFGYSDPGDGGVVAEIILFDPATAFAFMAGVDDNPSLSPAQNLAAHLTGGPCQAGALGFASYRSTAAGEVNTSFTMSTGLTTDGTCSNNGTALTLAPGQQFGILAVLHSYSSRGGFGDSFGTMSVALDPALPPEVLAQLNETLVSAPDAVPEPAMLGLFGMGALGLGLSRRRKAA